MNRRRHERHEAVCGGYPRTEGYRATCAAVRDWQQGALTADQATLVALDAAGGDEGEARALLGRAVTWWQSLGQYRDCNGNPIAR